MTKNKGIIIPEYTAEEIQAVIDAAGPKELAEMFGYEIKKERSMTKEQFIEDLQGNELFIRFQMSSKADVPTAAVVGIVFVTDAKKLLDKLYPNNDYPQNPDSEENDNQVEVDLQAALNNGNDVKLADYGVQFDVWDIG